MLSKVDLPQPEGPNTAKSLPSATLRLMLSATVLPENALQMCLSASIKIPVVCSDGLLQSRACCNQERPSESIIL